MPFLQVDGKVIAEIDHATAARLLGAAQDFGVGKLQPPATFQTQVGAMRARVPVTKLEQLTLVFQSSS